MQNKKDDKSESSGSSLKGLSFAYRISSELLAALIVSVILGLLIDKENLKSKHFIMDSNNDQVEKIQGEKNALRRQLIVLTILSFVISGLFYGITLAQNPYRKD